MSSTYTRVLSFGLFTLLGLGTFLHPPPVRAQGRLNDKDMQSLMKNLAEDAKSFRESFVQALKKTSIRKTSQEKDAKNLAIQFEGQTKSMLETFKRRKKADNALPPVLDTSSRIDRLVGSLRLDGQTTSKWDRVQSELRRISSGFGVDAAPSPAQNGPTCLVSVGPELANRLVAQCLQVSPATHPPCNAENSCALITDEIKRSCALLRPNAPGFCREYR